VGFVGNVGSTPIIGPKEKKRRQLVKERESRRNEEGLTQREKQKQDTIRAVQELKEQGLTQKKVAEMLNKGLRTVKLYWNLDRVQ